MGKLQYQMTKQAIEQNKEVITSLKGESPFLKAVKGTKYRIIPNLGVADNESWFQFINIHQGLAHQGKFVTIRCPKNDGDDKVCPICKYVAEAYKTASTQAEKDVLSTISQKHNFFVPVYVRNGTNADQVKWWKLSLDSQKKIQKWLESKRHENFTDIYNGTDLIMDTSEKMIKGKMVPMIEFDFVDDDGPLASTDEEMERIIRSQEPITEYIKTYTNEELKSMVENYISNLPSESDVVETPPAHSSVSASDDDDKLNDLLDKA